MDNFIYTFGIDYNHCTSYLYDSLRKYLEVHNNIPSVVKMNRRMHKCLFFSDVKLYPEELGKVKISFNEELKDYEFVIN